MDGMIRFLYRCRRCNVVDDSHGMETTKAHAMLLIDSAIHGTPDRAANMPALRAMHACTSSFAGDVGVSDLIGFRVDPESAKETPSVYPNHVQCGETVLVITGPCTFDIVAPDGQMYKNYTVTDTRYLADLEKLLAGDWQEHQVNELVDRLNEEGEAE